jgi:hypothetical protein
MVAVFSPDGSVNPLLFFRKSKDYFTWSILLAEFSELRLQRTAGIASHKKKRPFGRLKLHFIF